MVTRERRLLAVHAHADDETITMGGTLARYAAEGAEVALVCCTDGSLASIVDPDMAAREAEIRPRLADIRREELQRACAVLGVHHVHLLGYRDSGMRGAATNDDPNAFWRVDFDEAVGRLLAIVRTFRPHVVVTYDGYGGYGHPDHVQTHRVTLVAFEAAHLGRVHPEAGEPWRPLKLYYTAFPRSQAKRAVELAALAGRPSPFGDTPIEDLEFVTDDDLVTTAVDCRAVIDRKVAALREYRSQIGQDFPLLSVPEDVMREFFGSEHYCLAIGRVPSSLPETDLFAGID